MPDGTQHGGRCGGLRSRVAEVSSTALAFDLALVAVISSGAGSALRSLF